MSKNMKTSAVTHTSPFIKLPRFMENEPQFWFDIVDMKFNIARIYNPVVRFQIAFSALSPKAALLAQDLIHLPWTNVSYSRLKHRVTTCIFALQESRARQLFVNETMGDDKPSVFLERLKTLAGANISKSVLRAVWTSLLEPAAIRVHVEVNYDSPLRKAAEIGDRMYEIIKLEREMRRALAATAEVKGQYIDEEE